MLADRSVVSELGLCRGRLWLGSFVLVPWCDVSRVVVRALELVRLFCCVAEGFGCGACRSKARDHVLP